MMSNGNGLMNVPETLVPRPGVPVLRDSQLYINLTREVLATVFFNRALESRLIIERTGTGLTRPVIPNCVPRLGISIIEVEPDCFGSCTVRNLHLHNRKTVEGVVGQQRVL